MFFPTLLSSLLQAQSNGSILSLLGWAIHVFQQLVDPVAEFLNSVIEARNSPEFWGTFLSHGSCFPFQYLVASYSPLSIVLVDLEI